jgi:hypothetical protein
MSAHGGASVLSAAAAGFVAHQLVDHPGGDAGVLQPGRVGVAEVVGAEQIDRVQQGVAFDRRRRTTAGGLVLVLDVDRRKAGGVQLLEGGRNGGRLDGATVGS